MTRYINKTFIYDLVLTRNEISKVVNSLKESTRFELSATPDPVELMSSTNISIKCPALYYDWDGKRKYLLTNGVRRTILPIIQAAAAANVAAVATGTTTTLPTPTPTPVTHTPTVIKVGLRQYPALWYADKSNYEFALVGEWYECILENVAGVVDSIVDTHGYQLIDKLTETLTLGYHIPEIRNLIYGLELCDMRENIPWIDRIWDPARAIDSTRIDKKVFGALNEPVLVHRYRLVFRFKGEDVFHFKYL
jgi:hypothetical protein